MPDVIQILLFLLCEGLNTLSRVVQFAPETLEFRRLVRDALVHRRQLRASILKILRVAVLELLRDSFQILAFCLQRLKAVYQVG